MSEGVESPIRDADRVIYAGLLWLSVTCVLPMFEKGTHDLAQEVALYAFGFAIPFLAVGLITAFARRAGMAVSAKHEFVCVLGALSCVIGFGSLLLHVNVFVGCIFYVGCVVSLLVIRHLNAPV